MNETYHNIKTREKKWVKKDKQSLRDPWDKSSLTHI